MHVIYDGERHRWPGRSLFAIGSWVLLLLVSGPDATRPQEDGPGWLLLPSLGSDRTALAPAAAGQNSHA
jgi:hypothetical protein